MATFGNNETNTVIDPSRPEEILISSMKNIHLDAANKGNNKDADAAWNSITSPKPHRRQFKQRDDEERLSLVQEAQRSSRKLKSGQRYVRELTPYESSCPRRFRKTLEGAGMPWREGRYTPRDPIQWCLQAAPPPTATVDARPSGPRSSSTRYS